MMKEIVVTINKKKRRKKPTEKMRHREENDDERKSQQDRGREREREEYWMKETVHSMRTGHVAYEYSFLCAHFFDEFGSQLIVSCENQHIVQRETNV